MSFNIKVYSKARDESYWILNAEAGLEGLKGGTFLFFWWGRDLLSSKVQSVDRNLPIALVPHKAFSPDSISEGSHDF